MARAEIKEIGFQVRLIALMIKQPKFVGEFGSSIRPDWFEDKELQNIVVSILQFYKEYHTSPTYDELSVYMKRFVARDDAEAKAYKKLLGLIKQAIKSGGEFAFVRDNFKDFVQYSAYKQATLASARALQEDKWTLIPEIIRQAQRTTVNGFGGLNYFENILERLQNPTIRETIPTGIFEIDKLMHGGHARKELTTVLANTGVGKSILLTNLGAKGILESLNVVHLFTEESIAACAERYDSRLLHSATQSIRKQSKAATVRLEKLYARGGSLTIADCSKWDVTTLRSFVYEQDKPPDILIVDYADKLVAPRRYNERRFELEAIYDELLSMAKEFDCSVITASQAKVSAKHKEQLYPEDMGEAYLKSNIAHNIIALAQTKDEKIAQELRLFVAKCRFAESGGDPIVCKIIYSHMWITSKSQWMRKRTSL